MLISSNYSITYISTNIQYQMRDISFTIYIFTCTYMYIQYKKGFDYISYVSSS